MKMEGRVLGPGDAVGGTYYWDEERTAAFSATDGSPQP
jgi:hypothetical protein